MANDANENLAVHESKADETPRHTSPDVHTTPSEDGLTQPTDQQTAKKSGADIAAELLLEVATDVFTTPDGTPFIRLPVEDHCEVMTLNGTDIRAWLGCKLYQVMGRVPSSSAIAASLTVIRGKALSRVIELHNRVAPAEDEDGLWYDLSNETWQAVRVNKHGWKLVDEPPILFRRYQHQKPQVQPQSGGDFTKILQFVNVSSEKRLLFMVYVLSCFLPDIAHPVALFTGAKGSAKTTAASIVRRVVDPSQIETFSYPNQKAEVIQKLDHNWLAIFDNISSVPPWLSDVLCRASTGAGDSKRQLYSDDDDVIYSYRRCVGLTSIASVAEMPDLSDRSVTFELQRISPQQRRSEQELLAELDVEMPGILGGAFDVLCEAIRIKAEIQLEELPRMADFAEWGAAIAVALGYTQAEFIESYQGDIRDRNRDVVEAHPVGAAVKLFMADQQEWTGTASDLLTELEQLAIVEHVDTESKEWPKAPNWVKRRLDEVSTDLQEIGITIASERVAGTGERLIRIASTVGFNAENQHAELDDDSVSLTMMDDSLLDEEIDVAADLNMDLNLELDVVF